MVAVELNEDEPVAGPSTGPNPSIIQTRNQPPGPPSDPHLPINLTRPLHVTSPGHTNNRGHKTMFTPSQQPVIPTGYGRRFYRPDFRRMEEEERLEVGVLKWEDDGRMVTQGIQLDHEVKMGSSKSCKIRVYGNKVSDTHLIFYSVRTSSPLALVCMQDVSSTSGYILNGHHFHSGKRVKLDSHKVGFGVVVLRDGDTIQIPETTEILKYHHNRGAFPIVPLINSTIEDWTLFSTSNEKHHIDTNIWRIHNYPLGEGTFGVVNLATHKSCGLQVAIKTVDSRMSDKDDWEQHLKEEVGVMKRLSHPNILKVLDQMGNRGQEVELAHRAEGPGVKNGKGKGKEKMKEEEQELGEDKKGWDWGAEGIWKAHMVFELAAGGDLFSYCESNGRSKGLTEEETKFLAWQLILGIKHIHSRGIVHRDLKLENIMLHTRDSFPRLLIGDFGASITLDTIKSTVPKSTSGSTVRVYDRIGTVNYLPPERLKAFGREVKLFGLGESLHGKARVEAIGKRWFDDEVQLDIWALGVMLYQMMSGHHPYQDLTPFELASQGLSKIKPEPCSHADPGPSKEPIFLPRPASVSHSAPGPSQPAESSATSKPRGRKFADLDLDDETSQGSQTSLTVQKKRKLSGKGGGWDTFRKACGYGSRGTKGLEEDREVETLLVGVGIFKDKDTDEWVPASRWAEVSYGCKSLFAWILQYRREKRATLNQVKTHEWFTAQQVELDELYQTIVRAPALA